MTYKGFNLDWVNKNGHTYVRVTSDHTFPWYEIDMDNAMRSIDNSIGRRK